MPGKRGAMRVHLKGIHKVKMRLATGEVVFYYYAWRGGPRLKGAPGSAEFIRSYDEAHTSQRTKPLAVGRSGTGHELSSTR
jgi:hypothetical protein